MWTKTTFYDKIAYKVITMKINSVSISDSNLMYSSRHMHRSWEIIYNLSGSGEYIINDRTLHYNAGTVLICPPYTYHEKKGDLHGFQDLYINFSGQYFFSEKEITVINDDGNLKELFLMIYRVFSARDNGYERISEKILDLILTIILNKENTDCNSKSTVLLKNLIIDNLSNAEFKCIDAINEIPYNNDYIRRCFKRDTGMTPTEYLCKIRLNHAMNLLKQDMTPMMTISEISMYSGFYDVRYFARKFRKEFGITATDARSSN